jgi:hypothetical protein
MLITVKRLGLLWTGFFIPALVAWVALIQLTAHGRHDFAVGYHWTAHLLVLPLALSRLTDHWLAWLDGGGPAAVLGFLLLLAFWVFIVALPLSLVLTWANWLGTKMAGGPSSVYATDPYDPISGGSDINPATRLLYFVTIPLALVYHLALWLLRNLVGVALVCGAGFAVRFLYQVARLIAGDSPAYAARLKAMQDFYDGPYRLLGLHRFFGARWQHDFGLAQVYVGWFHGHNEEQYSHYKDHIFSFSDYHGTLPLLLWDAVMFGLTCAVGYLLLLLISKLMAHSD